MDNHHEIFYENEFGPQILEAPNDSSEAAGDIELDGNIGAIPFIAKPFARSGWFMVCWKLVCEHPKECRVM